jgi:hypothetical protein
LSSKPLTHATYLPESVQRKMMGCFRNGRGTMIYETVMTVLATWKQQGLNTSKAMAESLSAAWTKS